MSEPELPSLADALRLVLVGAPFLLIALRFAGTLLPARPAPAHGWTLGEVLAVCATPFVVSSLLSALLPGASVLASLLLSELVFGTTGFLAVMLAARRTGGLADLGLASGAPLRAFLVAPLLYAPWFFVSGGLGAAWAHLCRSLGWEEQQEILRLILELQGGRLVLAALVAVLLGPLLEELLFRGFLQSALTRVAGARGALVISSALFAALHGVAGLPVLFALSLFLGWLQLRTRSLLVPWSAHALHNAVQLGLALALGKHAG